MKREELEKIIENLEGQELTQENILQEVHKIEKYKNVKLRNIGIWYGYEVIEKETHTRWIDVFIISPSNAIRVGLDAQNRIKNCK